MSRKLALLTFFALSMLLLPLVAVAQVDRGSIKGVVHDEQNAVVPNATLVLKNESTGVELNSRSLSSGEYSFVSLPAGTYTLTTNSSQFAKSVPQHTLVTVGCVSADDVTLRFGYVEPIADVLAVVMVLQTETSVHGRTIA